jgi:hypothetical protein
MPIATEEPKTDMGPHDMTGYQLALLSSGVVSTDTRFGRATGGRVKNGCQVFLSAYQRDVQVDVTELSDVPYDVDVHR